MTLHRHTNKPCGYKLHTPPPLEPRTTLRTLHVSTTLSMCCLNVNHTIQRRRKANGRSNSQDPGERARNKPGASKLAVLKLVFMFQNLRKNRPNQRPRHTIRPPTTFRTPPEHQYLTGRVIAPPRATAGSPRATAGIPRATAGRPRAGAGEINTPPPESKRHLRKTHSLLATRAHPLLTRRICFHSPQNKATDHTTGKKHHARPTGARLSSIRTPAGRSERRPIDSPKPAIRISLPSGEMPEPGFCELQRRDVGGSEVSSGKSTSSAYGRRRPERREEGEDEESC